MSISHDLYQFSPRVQRGASGRTQFAPTGGFGVGAEGRMARLPYCVSGGGFPCVGKGYAADAATIPPPPFGGPPPFTQGRLGVGAEGRLLRKNRGNARALPRFLVCISVGFRLARGAEAPRRRRRRPWHGGCCDTAGIRPARPSPAYGCGRQRSARTARIGW